MSALFIGTIAVLLQLLVSDAFIPSTQSRFSLVARSIGSSQTSIYSNSNSNTNDDDDDNNKNNNRLSRGVSSSSSSSPRSPIDREHSKFFDLIKTATLIGAGAGAAVLGKGLKVLADETATATAAAAVVTPEVVAPVVPKVLFDYGSVRLPYDHVNYPLKEFLGKKATIVFNMKIDDPQTVLQFPDLGEIYTKYAKQGLNVLTFPTEQGWFEPDDDETVRAKAKEYYSFGDFPTCVVFDKIDLLGPSANPLYSQLTKDLLTPNGYGRITLNYEKFLLDARGQPVRRYPRKYSAYDMEADIIALLEDKELPPETIAYQKAWREAKREAQKSEYSFRYNYNYYTAPDSMYKYKPGQDAA